MKRPDVGRYAVSTTGDEEFAHLFQRRCHQVHSGLMVRMTWLREETCFSTSSCAKMQRCPRGPNGTPRLSMILWRMELGNATVVPVANVNDVTRYLEATKGARRALQATLDVRLELGEGGSLWVAPRRAAQSAHLRLQRRVVRLTGPLINQVLEIILDDNDELYILRYSLPSENC
jgi:hypothetical protein